MLYKCFVFAGQEDFLSNVVHFYNVCSMLGQRRRRWPNIETALGECLDGGSIQSCNQATSSTTLYCMLKAYTHASLERDFIFKRQNLTSIVLNRCWWGVIKFTVYCLCDHSYDISIFSVLLYDITHNFYQYCI